MSLTRILLLALCVATSASALPGHAQDASPGREYRVLLVGNSLTYTNNLPALLRAVGAAHGTPITTETYAAPGGSLSERWNDGHVAEALRARKFDAVVLQEKGGKLASCLATAEQRKAPCAASLRAYVGMAELARAGGAKPYIFTIWTQDERGQARLNRSARMIADKASATVFNAAGVLQALGDSDPTARLFPDGSHPSTRASLMLALALYREITGVTPTATALNIRAPLLPQNAAVSPQSAMETQAALAGNGTVTVVPASLVEPLVKALPAPKPSGEVAPAGRRR